MLQLILEKLVNVTPPESISPNILSQTASDMPGVKVIVQELPSIYFIRSFGTIIRIICETLAFYCIGEVKQWDQLLSDGTVRRHTDLQSLVIGFIYD